MPRQGLSMRARPQSVVLPKKVVNDIITGHKDLARKLRKAKVSSDPVRAVVTILSKKFSLPLTESSLSMVCSNDLREQHTDRFRALLQLAGPCEVRCVLT